MESSQPALIISRILPRLFGNRDFLRKRLAEQAPLEGALFVKGNGQSKGPGLPGRRENQLSVLSGKRYSLGHVRNCLVDLIHVFSPVYVCNQYIMFSGLKGRSSVLSCLTDPDH